MGLVYVPPEVLDGHKRVHLALAGSPDQAVHVLHLVTQTGQAISGWGLVCSIACWAPPSPLLAQQAGWFG